MEPKVVHNATADKGPASIGKRSRAWFASREYILDEVEPGAERRMISQDEAIAVVRQEFGAARKRAPEEAGLVVFTNGNSHSQKAIRISAYASYKVPTWVLIYLYRARF